MYVSMCIYAMYVFMHACMHACVYKGSEAPPPPGPTLLLREQVTVLPCFRVSRIKFYNFHSIFERPDMTVTPGVIRAGGGSGTSSPSGCYTYIHTYIYIYI
jgi:hypothetical protein